MAGTRRVRRCPSRAGGGSGGLPGGKCSKNEAKSCILSEKKRGVPGTQEPIRGTRLGTTLHLQVAEPIGNRPNIHTHTRACTHTHTPTHNVLCIMFAVTLHDACMMPVWFSAFLKSNPMKQHVVILRGFEIQPHEAACCDSQRF